MSTETQRNRIEEMYYLAVDKGPKGIWNVSLMDKVSGQLVAVFYGRGEIVAIDLCHTFVIAKNLHEQLRVCTAENQGLKDRIAMANEPAPAPEPFIPESPDVVDIADIEPDQLAEVPPPQPQITATGGAAQLLKENDIPIEEVAHSQNTQRVTLHDVQAYLRTRTEAVAENKPETVTLP